MRRARVGTTVTEETHTSEELESTLEAEIEVGNAAKPVTQLSAVDLPNQVRPTSMQ